jgi:hypothetical protein
MSDRGAARPEVAQVIGLFPRAAGVILRLFLADPGFRFLCEDRALAAETLTRLQAMPDPDAKPEIAEYVAVIADLESEIMDALRRAGASTRDLEP